MRLEQVQQLIVFGGTFDPPHRAHVELPRRVREALGFEAVAYIPAGVSPHKRHLRQTDPAHRLAMTRLAVADQPGALVLDVEVERERERGEPSYTVDTLQWLAEKLPGGAVMRLLIGTDQMVVFDSWREAQRIIRLAEPVVMVRPPQTRSSALAQLPADQRDTWASRLVDVPRIDVSSTQVRERAAAGQPIDDLTPAAVARYIREHGLYRAED